MLNSNSVLATARRITYITTACNAFLNVQNLLTQAHTRACQAAQVALSSQVQPVYKVVHLINHIIINNIVLRRAQMEPGKWDIRVQQLEVVTFNKQHHFKFLYTFPLHYVYC